jgi:hypothetical protein
VAFFVDRETAAEAIGKDAPFLPVCGNMVIFPGIAW